RDLVALGGDDPSRHREPVGLQQLREEVGAAVLRLAARDAVGDREHRGVGNGHGARPLVLVVSALSSKIWGLAPCQFFSSFVFSTRRTSAIVIRLSIALAMS